MSKEKFSWILVSVLLPNIAPTVSCITSDKSIFADPSKETPCIVLAVARAVAVSAFPVTSPVTFPVTFPSMFAIKVPVV